MTHKIKIGTNVSLASQTTIGLGGKAKYFVEVRVLEELNRALEWARKVNVPVFILGGGSNVVFADHGFQGLVIKIAFQGIKIKTAGKKVYLKVAAGEKWDSLVKYAVQNGWAGIEAMSGIPGLIGAVPIQNVGAYGADVSGVIESVEVIERSTEKMRILLNKQCGFGYRTSYFKTKYHDKFVITAVNFLLKKSVRGSIRYPELESYLINHRMTPTIQNIRNAVLKLRKKKSMIVDKNDPNSRSCGSFFVNPILNRKEFEIFKKNWYGQEDKIRYFQVGKKFKISAAWLIEQAGFTKGMIYRNVGISQHHSLALINRGKGSTQDLLVLKNKIVQKVQQDFGITLQTEPIIVN